MKYDFSLIKVTKHPKEGNAVIDFRPLFAAYKDLDAGDLKLPKAFDKELERLSGMPYSYDLVTKICEVAGRGFLQALKGEVAVAQYAIHSTVRSRHNRLQRAQAAQHSRLKQYVLPEQYRLVRGRPLPITEEELRKNRDALLEQYKAGILEIRTIDGRFVDLETFTISPVAPAQNPRPNPVLDSVANDIPTGIQFPKLVGGKVLDSEQMHKVVTGMTDLEGEPKVDPKDGAAVTLPFADEVEIPHDATEIEVPEEASVEEVLADEDEIEELPPGIPPPPPPPGGMPRNPNQNKKNKTRR